VIGVEKPEVAGGENGHLASGAIDRGNARPIQGPYLIGRDPIPHRVRRSRVGRVADKSAQFDSVLPELAKRPAIKADDLSVSRYSRERAAGRPEFANAKVVWACVSYALFQFAYSFVNIPYGSLAAAMTQEPDERAKLATGRVIASSLTILLIAIVVAPQPQPIVVSRRKDAVPPSVARGRLGRVGLHSLQANHKCGSKACAIVLRFAWNRDDHVLYAAAPALRDQMVRTTQQPRDSGQLHIRPAVRGHTVPVPVTAEIGRSSGVTTADDVVDHDPAAKPTGLR